MTDTNLKQIAISGLKVAAEASLVFLLVVGVCWGLGNLAEHQANRPIKGGGDGVVSLPAAKATLNGCVELGPSDKENQTSDFSYHFGRKLLAERNGRTVRNWTGEDSSVAWRFTIDHVADYDQQTLYEVTVRLAAPPESAGTRFTVSIVDISNPDKPAIIKRFESTVANTGGWDKWQTVSLGQVELAPGTYRLVVTPAGPIQGHGLMALSGVELQPKDL